MKKLLIGMLVLFALTACEQPQTTTPTKTAQSQKAAAAAESIIFTENAEIENIKKRLELTANPGLLGYVVLLNEMGQPVMYAGVKGKITSGGKRLTKPYELRTIPGSGGYHTELGVEAPSDEGTYGHSGEYVYFWTAAGQYIQWSGKYLYSDKPFRLSAEPLVVSVK